MAEQPDAPILRIRDLHVYYGHAHCTSITGMPMRCRG